MGRVLLLLLLGACDAAWGLHRPPADAPPADAELDAPPDAPPDGACTVVTRPAVIDGVLNAMLPMQPGTQPGLLNIQSTPTLNQVGIYKFEITGQPAAPPTQLVLHLPHADHDNACAAQCGTCMLDRAGSFRVYAMRNDWDQQINTQNLGATWNCRRGPSGCTAGDKWQQAGATGNQDRTSELATLVISPPASLDITISDPALVGMAWDRRSSALPPIDPKLFLSFQLAPADANGIFLSRALEHTCDVGQPVASLDLVYCP